MCSENGPEKLKNNGCTGTKELNSQQINIKGSMKLRCRGSLSKK
jgi:hypothetical protein